MGSRTCIGKNIAILEMQKLVPTLLRKFEFELAGELSRGKEWTTVNRLLVKPVDFMACVKARVVGKI